jgi:hypothetical protein
VGWGGDGAPGTGTLREFAIGAITQHFTKTLNRIPGVDFRLPTESELDALEAFQKSTGRRSDPVLTGPGAIQFKSEVASRGRDIFNNTSVGKCSFCHARAGAGIAIPVNANFDIGVQNQPDRPADIVGQPNPPDGGFGRQPGAPNGGFGNGSFNTPPLVEAADTGPFFHTATTVAGAPAHNTAIATVIEEAIAFYTTPAFNNSPAGQLVQISLTAEQIDDIGRFLRGINAAFNAALAVKRLDAAAALVRRFANTNLDIQREELRLANAEVRDAIRVLSGVPNLDAASLAELTTAAALVDTARQSNVPAARAATIGVARGLVSDASSKLGTNLTFQIGDGTVMF